MRREKEASEAEVRLAEFFDNRADTILKGTCTRSPCECWHPPECQFDETEFGCKAGDKCLFPHYKVDEQPSKKPKKSFNFHSKRKNDDKAAVAVMKTVPQSGCASHDSEPSRLPNGVKYRGTPRQKVLGSIRRVRFTQSTTSQKSSSAKSLRYGM